MILIFHFMIYNFTTNLPYTHLRFARGADAASKMDPAKVEGERRLAEVQQARRRVSNAAYQVCAAGTTPMM